MKASVLAALLAFAAPHAALAAQPPRQLGASRLKRALLRLSNLGRVLYVAAHPDDENTRLLAWLANDQLVRAAYLSITRGDGGQNLIGTELGSDLGIIRTQELLAARSVDGAEQLFTRARDFGYCKSPEEALRTWGHDEVLSDVVWAIRRFKPDVIVTRFPTSGFPTHGHHTASGQLADEAYELAADPTYHPEQVALVGTWRARRLVQNKPTFSSKPGDPHPGHVAIDVGGYDPALGMSYGELAADSRSMHKSQGFGVARSRGPALEYLKLLRGEPFQRSLLDGVDTSWARLAGGRPIGVLLARAAKSFDDAQPEKVLPILAEAYGKLALLPKTEQTIKKRADLAEAMVACAGLHLEAGAADPITVPGGTVAVTAQSMNRSPANVQLAELRYSDGTTHAVGRPLSLGAAYVHEHRLAVPRDAPLGSAYWLDEPPTPGLYTVRDAALIGLPERTSPLTVRFGLVVAGQRVDVERSVFHAWVDPVAGERWRSVEITPPVTITPQTPALLFVDDQPRTLRVRLKSQLDEARGEVVLELPAGFSASPPRAPFQLDTRGAEREVSFRVTPPRGTSEGIVRAVVELGGARLSRGLSRIEHAHIPIQTRYPESEVRVSRFSLEHVKKRIAYVPGAGDEVANVLRQVGYDVTILSDDALRDEPLARYEAIVTGVRAFNTNARLPFLHDRLMAYVAAGGTLLVQYNTNNRLSKVPLEIGPYPFAISQDRVTDERAAVTIGDHPALSAPNRISAADFTGWVQERGLYFGKDWDARYEAPLTMSDEGEPAQRGSLLIARHGKGTFVYTGLAFFRQLPAGVPGAFRLFANLLDGR